ncbi:MAG: VOC family protein [Pseudonocardiaceae bacterium]|nr:VOC family protein [Pseudonocardiaceae bacterium]
MSIYAAIRYTDPNAAIEWLSKAFGFEHDEVFRDDNGVVQHAVLSLGPGKILVSGPREAGWLGGAAADPLASPISVYVVVEDPTAHHDRAVAEGATILRDLEQMDYGSLEYSARDLDGNMWSFGTYQP